MGRRDRLIGLIVVEALLWMFMMSQSAASGPDSTISATLFGVRIFPLGLALLIAVCALPIIIGALSRSWQGAIALNLIASLPALVFYVLGFSSQGFGAELLYILTPLAALGWFGWLLRFVRAEFSE